MTPKSISTVAMWIAVLCVVFAAPKASFGCVLVAGIVTYNIWKND